MSKIIRKIFEILLFFSETDFDIRNKNFRFTTLIINTYKYSNCSVTSSFSVPSLSCSNFWVYISQKILDRNWNWNNILRDITVLYLNIPLLLIQVLYFLRKLTKHVNRTLERRSQNVRISRGVWKSEFK